MSFRGGAGGGGRGSNGRYNQYDDGDDDDHQPTRKPSSNPPQPQSLLIGTQQPALDLEGVKNKDKNKYLPISQQEVRDEKGRKRLHGAFTGGFSAGYYNTVGSKEGWQPQQFKSSRVDRAKAAPSRAEDFMDEEDLQEHAEGTKLAATEDFDGFGGTERELSRKRAVAAVAATQSSESAVGPLPGKLLNDLIGPSKDPIGMKLLRQMGWREGQGVGARVSKKRKAEEEEEDIHASNYSFAPKDSVVSSFEQKANLFGIGFNPHRDAPEFAGEAVMDDDEDMDGGRGAGGAAKFGVKGGFGTGMFDDEDNEGDVDVYDSHRSNFTIVIDDEEEEEEEFDAAAIKRRLDLLAKEKKLKSASVGARASRGVGGASDVRFRSKDEPISTFAQYCHDGKPSLRGFILASISIAPLTKWFEAPQPPPDFIPIHRFDLPPGQHPPPPPNQRQQQKELTADQRRDILGETALPGPSRSVFSYIAIKEQDRLLDFIDRASTSSTSQMKLDKQAADAANAVKGGREDMKVGKDVAEAALKGFMPFGNDVGKQGRYKRFLEVCAGRETEFAKVPMDMPERDANHETVEFSKAAQIFQPLSATMASRFTSASAATASVQFLSGQREGGQSEKTTVTSQAPAPLPNHLTTSPRPLYSLSP